MERPGKARVHGARHAAYRIRHPVALWLGIALSAMTRAEAANPLVDAQPRNVEVLLVLLAGVGVLMVAAAVIAFAIRQLRRESRERRHTYTYRRRGPDGAAPPPARPD